MHVKYKSRFFRLLEVFLSSSLISSHCIASFIKKLSVLSLNAPVAGTLILLPFIHNLFRRHPSCIKMIHQSTDFTPTQLDGVHDAFNSSEQDPEHTNAINSFLWEVVALKMHWHPSVSGLARMFGEEFGVDKYDLEDFLEFGYDGLMVDEGNRKKIKPSVEGDESKDKRDKRGRSEAEANEFACSMAFEYVNAAEDDSIFAF